VRQHLRFSVSA